MFTILLLYVSQVFINLQDHLHYFVHFVFSFMGQLFMDDPISDVSIKLMDYGNSFNKVTGYGGWNSSRKRMTFGALNECESGQ